jgi:adenosine deaminase
VAAQVHACGITLELCPTSNVHTGAVASVAAHPFDRFRRLGFTVTVNTDNRLMSGVTASSELGAIADAFDLGPAVWQALTEQAVAAAFLDEASRTKLLDDVIRPRYAALDAGSTGPAHEKQSRHRSPR